MPFQRAQCTIFFKTEPLKRIGTIFQQTSGRNFVPKQNQLYSTKAFDGYGEPGVLVLEDGTTFHGTSFGAFRPTKGEVVFNTGMVGYPESLTDPSYNSQILAITYPLVGNYGVPLREVDEHGLLKHFESDRIHVSGLLVANYSENYSHWQAERSLSQWLKDENIPALTGIDTRALTRKLRSRGVMVGKILFGEDIDLEGAFSGNMVARVSTKEVKVYGKGQHKIIAVDCGMKYNIIRELLKMGDVTIKVVPWDYDFTNEDYDGLFISNGPGDPTVVHDTINNIKKAFKIGKPIFGICMGNQLMSIAAGAQIYKLKYGNRGQNLPAEEQVTGQVYITSQNHGYAVDNQTLPSGWKPYFININDGSNEGIMHSSKPFFSVQFHPEARGGPYDTRYLFKKFYETVISHKNRNTALNHPVKSNLAASKVLIIGSGALQIGQAGEFDYSGSQCIKALKEEGVESVLINPNIATVQTAKNIADNVYLLPVTPEYVEGIIARERPDGVLLGFGGQTGLNTGVELYNSGVFQKYGVKVLGTSVDSIVATEDREIFNQKLAEIGEPFAKSFAVTNLNDALKAASTVGYPVIIRAAFALGGLGSGFAYNPKELEELANRALSSSPQILVEKSLKGWKEVEYEVVRDSQDNCITVCNMENFDPMGIHTGESIVVAPSQTLTNEEYHMLRTAAIRTVRHLGIVGECNIQYSIDPNSLEYSVIEVNPRLSRSSALASKATGYPLAFVAAKIALGIPMHRISNSVTKCTSACFEPSLDYIVTKVPRWDLKKFERVSPLLGSQMKSVGEVMAIGRSFEESLQKALRMVDTSNLGFESKFEGDVDDVLKRPTPERIFAISKAFDMGYSVDKIHAMTSIDKWFLQKLKHISTVRNDITKIGNLSAIPHNLFKEAKQAGFSDKQIAKYINTDESEVRQNRKARGITPVVKQIDTLAAEFPAQTNYLYMTYNAQQSDIPEGDGSVIVLGSGTYRIGSSVEFDYCAVSATRNLTKRGEKTVMVNFNPETVSTDYDESDKLYFEEISVERVLDIVDRENPKGTIVSVGGQQPQNIALQLYKSGVHILGTSPLMIDQAEDRYKFSKLLDSIGVKQPEWKELRSMEEATEFSNKVGFPVLIRPSYVLSGAAMNVASNNKELTDYLTMAADVNPDHPVVITKFIKGAREVEVDGVANKGTLVNWAISEHIENAGVHSGDATLILPSDTLSNSVKSAVFDISGKIAKALQISGPLNVQFLVKGDDISVIECNLRASRSFPFCSKTYDIDFIETAVKIFMGDDVQPNYKCNSALKYVGVKAPQFSFQRLHGADPILGVEMASTGEVACFGENKYEAFLKAMTSVPPYFKMPTKNRTVMLSGNVTEDFMPACQTFVKGGFTLFATPEVASHLKGHNIPFTAVDKPDLASDNANNAISWVSQKKIDLVINFPHPKEDISNYHLRRRSVDYGVPCLTNEQICAFLAEALLRVKDFPIKNYNDYLATHE